MRRITPKAARMPNVGCNLNLPGSHAQNLHMDGYAASPFMVVNVAAVDTAGDVVIRVSSMWHRGMPNRTERARPMLALSWEDGGSRLDDPYAAHEGKTRFFPNRYGTDLSSELKERAFAALPRLGSGYRFVRSLLER